MRTWSWYLLGILTALLMIVGGLALTPGLGIWLLGILVAITIGAGGMSIIRWLAKESRSTIIARSRAWYLSGILTVLIMASAIFILLKSAYFMHPSPSSPSPSRPPTLAPVPSSPGLQEEVESENSYFPAFRWPPHKFTTHFLVPMRLVVLDEQAPLGSMFDRLISALGSAQISDWSAYAIGRKGFAIVSRLECIGDDGKAKQGTERWCTGDTRPPYEFSISSYIRSLFSANPGRYRIIVFTVTPRTVRSNGVTPSEKTMRELLSSGALDNIPEDLRNVIPGPGTRCTALIYEFYRPAEDDPPYLVAASTITAVHHIVGASLWSYKELH